MHACFAEREKRQRSVYVRRGYLATRVFAAAQESKNVARVCTIQRKIANDRREEEAIGVAQGLSLLKQQQ
jgi:hypothetical protein